MRIVLSPVLPVCLQQPFHPPKDCLAPPPPLDPKEMYCQGGSQIRQYSRGGVSQSCTIRQSGIGRLDLTSRILSKVRSWIAGSHSGEHSGSGLQMQFV